MASDKIKQTSDSTFQSDVLDASLKTPVLVDFWAVWCGPCRAIAPHLDAIAGELGDKLTIVKLDVDSNQDTATKYGVSSIPTLLIFKDGKVVDKVVGNPGSKARLQTFILPHT
jgi:thioredoxin 1